jgi:hypothetical protein
MKQLKKMSARDTISCDVTKNLLKPKSIYGKVENQDLELYNKDGTTDVSLPPQVHSGSEKKDSSIQKMVRTSGEWKASQLKYLEMSSKKKVQPIFSSNHDNDINCYDYSSRSKLKTKNVAGLRKKKNAKPSWGNFKQIKSKEFLSRKGYERKGDTDSKNKVGMTWDEIIDHTDSSKEKVNLVYRQKKSKIQRSSRIVDIYKEKSKAMYEPKKLLFRSKKKKATESLNKKQILAQFDEIQLKYNIDLTKSKQTRTGRKIIRDVSPKAFAHQESRPERKALRLKPSKQLKLEGLISDDHDKPEKGSENLSQYQSLNYSVDPLMKKQKKKSISQKKFKDYSEQIKRRAKKGNKPLHVRNKSSATLIENKFVRVRPNKMKKISLNEQRSMHSEILSNLREQSYRYIPKAKTKNYFQKISKKKFTAKIRNQNKHEVKQFDGGSEVEEIPKLQTQKDLQIKEYEPYVKSMDTESMSFVNNVDHIQIKEEIFLKDNHSNKFASHQEIFDNISKDIPDHTEPGPSKLSLKKNSRNNSVFNDSLKPKRNRREHSEPKELIKKSLQHKKQSVYKKSILNYTKPKNRKYKRKKDKNYLKDFSTLRAGESFKVKEKNMTQKTDKDFSRFNLPSKKKFTFKGEKKFCFQNQNSPNVSNMNRKEELPVNSLTLNGVAVEAEKKPSFLVRKNRHYIINDILEKKGIDLNVLSNKNVKKGGNKDFVFWGKESRKEVQVEKQPRKKSRSVKISLNNIRSSVVHLEKALAKEKNRLKNICNVTKNKPKIGLNPKLKKTNKKKTINLNLKPKENCDLKSPKNFKMADKQLAEETHLKKKINMDKKNKKKTGKLSTKNLLNKFNKMSYFDYKKNRRGKQIEKQTKKHKRYIAHEDKLYLEGEDTEHHQVGKTKKTHLYER